VSTDFLAHGVTLTLAWFVAVNIGACAAAALLATMVPRIRGSRTPLFWMILRLAPAGLAGLFALALFVPSYVRYEPREGVEGFDVTLTLTAIAGAAILATAVVRGLAAWLGARRRVRVWMQHAQPIAVGGTSLPAFAIDAEQPMIALVGVLRPALLVTRGLIAVLTAAELEAAVAHELGHQRAFDNLKRLLMRAAPDVLTYLPSARLIERRWAAAAEHAADRIGGPNAAAARCALASALVKVARLTPATIAHAEPISTLISGGEIASRVQTLLSDDAGAAPAARAWTSRAVLASGAGLAAALAYAPVLRAVHDITEVLVHSLP
jgi:Peptidase family M48